MKLLYIYNYVGTSKFLFLLSTRIAHEVAKETATTAAASYSTGGGYITLHQEAQGTLCLYLRWGCPMRQPWPPGPGGPPVFSVA